MAMSRLFLNMFYYGNVIEEEAQNLAKKIEDTVKLRAISTLEIPAKRVGQVPRGRVKTMSNENWLNVAVVADVIVDVDVDIDCCW